MKRSKTTFKVMINWNGEIKTYHSTTYGEMQAIRNCCHKLGRETNISGNYILRSILDTSKVHTQRV